MAAGQARRIDPTQAAKYHRLMTDAGKHHNSALCYPSARLAEAIKIRAGACRFPTCTVPADRCDLDHHDPHPRGPTSGANMNPGCRRHHGGKPSPGRPPSETTTTGRLDMPDAEHYRCIDEPLPTGRAGR